MSDVWEWKVLCLKDHMHRWERSAVNTNIICTAEPRDNPVPQDAEMATVIESIEWVSVKQPMITTLAGMLAAAKNQMAVEMASSVMADLPRNPIGISSLSRGQVGDNKLHLYGNMTNYKLVMQYKPQQRA